jgi:hypothetical protein
MSADAQWRSANFSIKWGWLEAHSISPAMTMLGNEAGIVECCIVACYIYIRRRGVTCKIVSSSIYLEASKTTPWLTRGVICPQSYLKLSPKPTNLLRTIASSRLS